jgi:tripartite ATP-independent transporter DctM subunit
MDTGVIALFALSFFVLLLVGVPIAFAIGLSTAGTLLLVVSPLPALTTIAQRMATGLDSFALVAIPFFVLSGELMNRGGIARRLVDFAKVVVGWLPGALAYVNILGCMLFGSISGSSAAAAAAIGGFMHPLMQREGYDRNFGAAVNISSATTGLIIPPSNILIVYSLASGGVSIAALFLAGYVPGILLGLGLMIVAGVMAVQRGYPAGSRIGAGEGLRRFLDAVPSLLLLIVIMGGIVGGIFTATEASAVAVVYTFVLSVIVYREVRVPELPDILLRTAVTTSIVMLLVGTSMAMSWAMAFENIPQNVAAGLLEISQNPVIVLLLINALLLVVGTFMDMTPAVLVFTPIFLPAMAKLGMDPVHFGVVMVMNLCIGLCTPPVGSVLFVGAAVARTTITDVIRPLLPMYAAMVVVLVIVIVFPSLSLWLPRLFGF